MAIEVDIIQDVETFLRNLNGYELLSYAICNEECGAETYEWLAGKTEGPVSEELERLAKEKRKHAVQMRQLFEELYPGLEPLDFNAPPLDALPLCCELMKAKDIEDALAIALLSESIARDVYKKLQRMSKDEKVAGLFARLAGIKEESYRRLLKLYESFSGKSKTF
ncbi:ferritin family protein [Thermococcus sp.]|uniref:ferritin-like domain-containing protein n=1 Tax=Thermococcus sp. TaxID=35749 RepID=UPI0026217C29|nr:ferritin family protein [Thermococcus sp.]